MKRIYIFILVIIVCISGVLVSVFSNTKNQANYVFGDTLSKNNPTIIIDAGHGGEDGGAVSATGLLEKDVNLDICLTLEKLLKQSGYSVRMIRSEDVSIHDDSASTTRERKVSDIKNRVNIVNSDKNNVLISIHQNFFTESQYFGTQIFYSRNNSSSKLLAENIRTAVTALLQPENTRKCKESSNVFLLDNATVPAIIVECGFLSNPDESYKLSQKEYRDNLAYSIYLGILEYTYLYK